MNPPIITLSPVCTKARVKMLPNCDPADGAQYLPPVSNTKVKPSSPPQMIISLPIHTAVCWPRGLGPPPTWVALQLFVTGLYFPQCSRNRETHYHYHPQAQNHPRRSFVPVQTAV